jgi:creatinine amidohydrolase
MNWMQVEDYLKRDDRAVLPVGSTEQHAHLSLMVDCILAERVALEAAAPVGVPVFPPINFGIAPYFRAFPGTISLRTQTLLDVIQDVLDCLTDQGFRRILIVNGHGGNSPVSVLLQEWSRVHPGTQFKFHNWWKAPRTWEKVMAIDPVASHASWMENFPWTRLAGIDLPTQQKAPIDFDRIRDSTPRELRALIGDGNFGGFYQRSDDEMVALWAVAVEETRQLLESGWE